MVLLLYALLPVLAGGLVGFASGRYWSLLVPVLVALALWWASEPNPQGDVRGFATGAIVVCGVSGAFAGVTLRRAARRGRLRDD